MSRRLLLLALPAMFTPAGRADDQAQNTALARLLQTVEDAKSAGEFARAEQALGEHLADVDSEVACTCADALEIIRRIRLDYSLTADGLLTKLRKDIPDTTSDDLERWRNDGGLQYRIIDGQVRYFSREPSNLYRFCPEARSRRDEHRSAEQPTSQPKPDFVLTGHLARLVEIGEAADNAEIFPIKHHVTYTLKVHDHHPLVKAGAQVRCWLPFPQEYRQQKDVRLVNAKPGAPTVAPNGCAQRTVYFEQTVEDPSQPVEFSAEFTYTCYAYYPKLDPAKVKPYDSDSAFFKENTAERPPHIVFSPEVPRVVAEVCGDERNPLERARKLFRWVSRNIRYCSEMEYSTIPSLSAKALATQRGDCGVQGIAFITLCRAAGIPARWQSGWETKPVGWDMHDWAEFYVEPWGWLPADPSYGLQNHPDPRVQEFYCGHMDAYRMIVNLDYARALHPAKTSLRSEPNDFQRGEIEIDGRNLYFDEWDWTFDLKAELLPPAAPRASTPVGPEGIGTLYLPSSFKPRGSQVDLLIHFHGGAERVAQAAEEAAVSAAVVSVTRPGLSKVYEEPFSDDKLLDELIRSTLQAVNSSGRVESSVRLGRLYLSSFSAGFGALRAILRVPSYFERIDGLILADSLYCGYQTPAPSQGEGEGGEASAARRPDGAKMADFHRFAKQAAAGEKFMLLTHSAQIPDGYASTTETADDLIAFVGAQRVPDESAGPGSMQRRSRADLGGFHVRGFAGDEGQHHVQHLTNLTAWYKLLPIAGAGDDRDQRAEQ